MGVNKKNSETKNFNSVQLNLVTFVDVQKANYNQSLESCVYMMDNSIGLKGQGTPELVTVCKPGQILNWIIYPIDGTQRPDGTWPPSVKINNIVFLNKDGENVSDKRICSELKIFGGPDKVRSKFTPVYYYWAGIVIDDLPPDTYHYRLVLEVETENSKKSNYFNLNTPALEVIAV